MGADRAHDPAGLPWSGRELTGTGFDADDGAADPALLAALADVRRSGEGEAELVAAMSRARLLVPIVAAPTELAEVVRVDDADGRRSFTAERSTDLAVVTLTASDGQRALPVFTGVESLAAWDALARPVPVISSRAAQAAVAERCDVMVLDLGAPQAYVLRPSMVWALAQGRTWLPAHADPFVAQALARAAAQEPDVVECACGAGEPARAGILRVVLTLRPGLGAAQVQELATRIGEHIATDGETRARIDALAFTIRPE